MKVNEIPKIDMNNSETGCCPRFNPEQWDNQRFEFNNKLFVKGKTISLFHVPLNMGSMYGKVWKAIEDAKADLKDSYLILSYDPSPWKGEHFFAVTKDVPGQEMVKLTGRYLTKVFEGPYKNAGKWVGEMEKYCKEQKKKVNKLYFFYTTCPKCAKTYGKNYIVAFAEYK